MLIEIFDENNDDVASANCTNVIWNSPFTNEDFIFTSKLAFQFDNTYLI